MVTIRTECPTCGDVDLEPSEVSAIRCHNATFYTFTCPKDCARMIQRPAGEDVLRLLVFSGVKVTLVATPEEAKERHDGPPICLEDLAAFHRAIRGTIFVSREAMA